MTRGIAEFKADLIGAGFEQHALLDEERMNQARDLLDREPHVVETPPEELRFIEGLLRLPLNHLDFFRVIPEGTGRCACGRTTTALDVVAYAATRKIHDLELLRDTLIGLRPTFEIASGGRTAECYRCGRPVVMRAYHTSKYMYA